MSVRVSSALHGEEDRAEPGVSALGELGREIRRRWGEGVTSSRRGGAPVRARPTGAPSVDALLPGGGVPVGALTEVSGAASCGKSSLVMRLAASVLRGGERVAWVDPAGQFDASSAERAGVPLADLWWIQPRRPSSPATRTSPTERASMGELFRTAEALVGSGSFALVVLDVVGRSTGALSPLFRLSRRAERHGTSVVFVTDRGDQASSLASCIALRVCIERRTYCFEPSARPPCSLMGYRLEVQVGRSRAQALERTCKSVEARSAVGLSEGSRPPWPPPAS